MNKFNFHSTIFLISLSFVILMTSCAGGKSEWMDKNLSVSNFRNGDPIQEVKSSQEWHEALKHKTPAWCSYQFNSANDSIYGRIYNVYAVLDYRGLAPEGYRIATEEDWEALIESNGGKEKASKSIKSTTLWKPHTGKEDVTGNNKSGFNAMPGNGFTYCNLNDQFCSNWGRESESCKWWTTSPCMHFDKGEMRKADLNLSGYNVYFASTSVYSFCAHYKDGCYVRCVKDNSKSEIKKPELHTLVLDSLYNNYRGGSIYYDMTIENNRQINEGQSKYDSDLWDSTGRPRKYKAIPDEGSMSFFGVNCAFELTLIDPYTGSPYYIDKKGIVQTPLKVISPGLYEGKLIMEDKSEATITLNPLDSIRVIGNDWSVVFNKFGQQAVLANDLDFYGVDKYKEMYGIE
jgi:uncharacterized protein (TIGR02145 family)